MSQQTLDKDEISTIKDLSSNNLEQNETELEQEIDKR